MPDKDKGSPIFKTASALHLLPLKDMQVASGREQPFTVAVERVNCPDAVVLEFTRVPKGLDFERAGRIPAGVAEITARLRVAADAPPGLAEVTVTARCGELSDSGRFRVEVNQFTNKCGMKLVRVPAGTFKMGSSTVDLAKLKVGRIDFADEAPQRAVEIRKPFYLGKHEVTRGQFRCFADDDGYKTDAETANKESYGYNPKTDKFDVNKECNWRNAGFDQTDEHPVVCVSWNDAVAFCNWLSRREGRRPCYQRAGATAVWECDFSANGYRLPTEAEWEYACRAGTRTRYASGDDPESLAAVGNVADGTFKLKFKDSTTIAAMDGFVFTAPVGTFKPNAFGLHDMHGNAWEWCHDRYAADYYGKGDNKDPQGPETGTKRVLRGGSWNDSPRECRAAYRFKHAQGRQSNNVGFRVALSQRD